MRTRFIGGLSALALSVGMLASAGPAAQATSAAYPTRQVDLSYGASYIRGTLTFYNRSVGFKGTIRALSSSGCRYAKLTTIAADNGDYLGTQETRRACNSVISVTESITADRVGGACSVFLEFFHGDGRRLTWFEYEHLDPQCP